MMIVVRAMLEKIRRRKFCKLSYVFIAEKCEYSSSFQRTLLACAISFIELHRKLKRSRIKCDGFGINSDFTECNLQTYSIKTALHPIARGNQHQAQCY